MIQIIYKSILNERSFGSKSNLGVTKYEIDDTDETTVVAGFFDTEAGLGYFATNENTARILEVTS